MSEPLGASVALPDATILRQQIADLDIALKAAAPNMDSLLQTIHRNLSTDPALVHLLKEEEIATVILGLEQKTRTKILEATVKSASSGKNRGLSKLGANDLGMDI